MNALSNFTAALPELFLALGILSLLVWGVTQKQSESLLSRTTTLSIIGLIVTGGLIVTMPAGYQVGFNGMFVMGSFAAFAKILILLASVTTLVMAPNFLQNVGVKSFEFPILICLATLGMMVMVSANHFLTLYLGLELFSLSTYVLVSIQRESSLPSEAGLKYFILGAVASGFILFGVSLVYGFVGSVQYETIALVLGRDVTFDTLTPQNMGLIVGLVFLLCGLAFKVSAAPFHMWTPDVYQGAPTIVTAFLSMAPKIAVFAVITRILIGAMWDVAMQWQQIIIIVSVLSMIVGAFGALTQANIKRFLGYSTIGHVGYALLGLAAGTEKGVAALLVYLAIYFVMSAGVFAIVMMMRQKDQQMTDIIDLEGFARTQPFMGFCMAALMFSMAGIPPLAGFFGKFFVIKAVVDAGMVWLGALAVITTVVAAYYYIRIVGLMYLQEPSHNFNTPLAKELHFMATFSTALVLLFVFMPRHLIEIAAQAARSLFIG